MSRTVINQRPQGVSQHFTPPPSQNTSPPPGGRSSIDSMRAKSRASRKHLLLHAISEGTGISKQLLQRIELGMDQRVYYPMLSTFLMRRLVPSSAGIIVRLLSSKGQVRRGKGISQRLYTEYRICVTTSQGTLRIIANLKVSGGGGLFGKREPRGVICVRYQIEQGQQMTEYCQNFYLDGSGSLRSRQYGVQRSGQSGSAVMQLFIQPPAPRPLLAPAQAIYL